MFPFPFIGFFASPSFLFVMLKVGGFSSSYIPLSPAFKIIILKVNVS